MQSPELSHSLVADGARLRRIGQRPTEPSERLVLGLLAQMPADRAERFDALHVAALREAAQRVQWGRHPLDLRFGLPLGTRRAYLVIVGGLERRAIGRDIRGHAVALAAVAALALVAAGLGLHGLG
jgi:hypothetical protein